MNLVLFIVDQRLWPGAIAPAASIEKELEFSRDLGLHLHDLGGLRLEPRAGSARMSSSARAGDRELIDCAFRACAMGAVAPLGILLSPVGGAASR